MEPFNRKHQLMWLALGTALLALGQVRCGVGLLAWTAPIPFLVFLGRTSGWRSRLTLIGVLCVAWSLAAAKYITPPLPYSLIVLNGVSYGVVNGVGYLVWDRLRRGLPAYLSNLAFPAIHIGLEWLQYRFTPLASNGAAAYTQLENLPYLQFAAVFGIAGLSFLMYWFAAVAADALVARRLARIQTALVLGIIVLVNIGGAIRIGYPVEQETVRVATVGTDFMWFGGPLPSDEEQRNIERTLFERTESAAESGAKLIVWNEVSTIVDAEDESRFIARAKEIARGHGIHLVMSYLAPVQPEPLLVKNKYTWVGPAGDLLDTYLKHKPLPGEPSIPGDGNAKVIETDFGRVTGAICYDFDFPQIGLDRASKGADIVFVPSSDAWGVDPFHTQIAAVRAIEGGYSVVRSTRMGLSAAIDPHGRIRGWLSTNETSERILLATIPNKSFRTIYSMIGDSLVYAALVFLLALTVWRVRGTR